MHFVSCKVANQEMCYGQSVLGVIACKYACMLERAYKSNGVVIYFWNLTQKKRKGVS